MILRLDDKGSSSSNASSSLGIPLKLSGIEVLLQASLLAMWQSLSKAESAVQRGVLKYTFAA
jgi:hypothetical protein